MVIISTDDVTVNVLVIVIAMLTNMKAVALSVSLRTYSIWFRWLWLSRLFSCSHGGGGGGGGVILRMTLRR